MLGWRTVCAVEWDQYAASVLVARQNDGCLRPFPVWDDVQTFDGSKWRGRVDVVSGGFPCQDISVAGKGAGISGERSGMWKHMARIVCEVRPRFVFVENSPALASRGLGVVLGDLAAMGYDAEWCVLGASDVGAPHRRKRIWILAESVSINEGKIGEICKREDTESCGVCKDMAHAEKQHGTIDRQETSQPGWSGENGQKICWWSTEPDVGRVVNGLASRLVRLKCLGNGQVPAVAATAFRLLYSRIRGDQ